MKVIQTVIGRQEQVPVDISYYQGDSMAAAMAAVVSAMESATRDDTWFTVLSVRVDI